MERFIERVVLQRGSNAVADTTAETKSNVADMQGFDEVTFAVEFADVDAAAVLTFTVKENSANSTTTPTPTKVSLSEVLSGLGAITSGTLVITEDSGNLDNKTVLITVKREQLTKRYAFLSITVADESYEVNAITIVKSRAKAGLVSQGSSVVSMAA